MARRTPQRVRDALARETWKALAWAVPAGIAAHFTGELVGSLSAHPVRVLGALLPLAVAVVILVRPLVRDRRLLLGGGAHAFLVTYVLLFTLAAGSRLLTGRRVALAGYDEAVPSNFLGLGRLGDWHYRLLPPPDEALDLLLVTLPSFQGDTVWQARRAEMALVRAAVDEGAEGIAFDYVLRDPSVIDRVLCTWIGRAETAGVEVLFGYKLNEVDGLLVREPLPPDLRGCLPEERLGSLTGYQEADGRVRMVPLFVQGDSSRPALSHRIAAALPGGPGRVPGDGLLQFTEARIPVVRVDSLEAWPVPEALQLFRDRFVIVGSHREGDRVETPYGTWAGVEVHANAAHSLRAGHAIRRVPRAWYFPLVLVVCYVLAALQLRGGVRPLLVGAVALSLAVVVMAASAMRTAMVWVDVSYALAAMWLLVPVMAGGARVQKARLKGLLARDEANGMDASLPAQPLDGPWDVFLSYNRSDFDDVLRVGEALRRRGLTVWLDHWCLIPGRSWQEAVEEVIESAASAAVFVGPEGLGPWEAREMRALLDELVSRDLPVVPVLLPGAGNAPRLPPFLRALTWVDLRDGVHRGGLDRLEWGITGVRPTRGGNGTDPAP